MLLTSDEKYRTMKRYRVFVWLQVFVEYTDTQGAAKAKLALNGRKFSGNSVVAVYYPEDKFGNGDYSG